MKLKFKESQLLKLNSILVLTYIVLTFFVSESIRDILKIVTSIVISLTATYIAYRGYRKNSEIPEYRKFLVLAMGLYTFGDIFWLKDFRLDRVEIPVMHLSFISYLGNTFLLAMAVFFLIKNRLKKWNSMRVIIDGFLMGGMLFYLVWSFFLSEFYNFIGENGFSDMKMIFDFIYVLMNFLTIFVLGIFCSLEKNYLKKSKNRFEIIGFSLFFIADLIYIYSKWNDIYLNNRFIDIIWPIALVMIAYSSLENKKTVEPNDYYEEISNGDEKRNYFFFSILVVLTVVIFFREKSLFFILFMILVFRMFLSKHLYIYEKNELLTLKYNTSNMKLIQSEEMNEKLYTVANIDSLTKIFNRRRLMSELENLIESGKKGSEEKFALLFMDLDKFKSINDTYGHDVGDLLLIETVERLKKVVDERDIVARQGGDEFIIIFRNIENIKSVEAKCHKIVDAIKEEFYLAKKHINTSASLGVAIYPDDATELIDLLKYSDLALYKAKKMGRNRYVIYDDEMRDIEFRKLQVIRYMYRAIKNREFSLKYQPEMELSTNKIKGMEVLLRWNNPILGEIEPGEFIPLAEENDFINQIGKYVFIEALKDIKRINEQYGTELKFSLNVSARHFYTDEFIHVIKNEMKKRRVKPQWINIEITETAQINNEDKFLKKIGELSSLGISICIAEFGKGYSSFVHLKKGTVDTVKIPRDFIHGIEEKTENYKIVRAITVMCREMGIEVSAVGAENREQLEILKELGCYLTQGNYISEPLTLEDLESKFLNKA